MKFILQGTKGARAHSQALVVDKMSQVVSSCFLLDLWFELVDCNLAKLGEQRAVDRHGDVQAKGDTK